MNPTNFYTNDAASDFDEVLSVYAFECTSFESYENDEVMSVYAYEKPNETCPIGWHEFEGCHCGKPADYCEDGAGSNVDAAGDVDAMESDDDDDAFEKESVYAYEKLNASCPIDWHPHIPNSASSTDTDDSKDKLLAQVIFFLIVSLAVAYIAFNLRNLHPVCVVGFIVAFVFFDAFVIALFSLTAAISANAEATIEDTDDFGFQVNNRGTSISYKMVTNDWTLEFINEKTTVYNDKSSSTITLHYSGYELVSVTHDDVTYTSYETVPSEVADLLVAARVAVNQLWQMCETVF